MITEPIREIIPEKIDDFLITVLNKYSKTIDEVVNFGTHLLQSDIDTNNQIRDGNIPTVFLRNILEIGDSISILIRNSSIDPAKILVRSLVENNYGLQYMIEKDESFRTKAFMVWRAKKDIKFHKQFISSNASSNNLRSKAKNDSLNIDIEKFFDLKDVSQFIETKTSLLRKEGFKEVSIEYEKTAKKLKTKNPNWYSLKDGPKNFHDLCSYLGKSMNYEFIYRKYSENSHITGVMKGFAHDGNGRAQVIQIRDFENHKDVFDTTIWTLLECFSVFVNKRILHDKQRFQTWYKIFRKEYTRVTEGYKINYKK